MPLLTLPTHYMKPCKFHPHSTSQKTSSIHDFVSLYSSPP